MIIASFDDLDLIQCAPSNFKLIERDSGFALETYVNVSDVSALVMQIRKRLHE